MLLDPYKHKINYLRISVTDRCTLRCRYCMPEDGIPLSSNIQALRQGAAFARGELVVEGMTAQN